MAVKFAILRAVFSSRRNLMRHPLRYCPAGIPVHVIQRGNNRIDCFRSNQDYATYANCLDEAARKYGVDIHAWVFMTNHVHILVTPQGDAAVSRMMQYLGRLYVRYFNQVHSRSGTLWEGRFRSCLVDTEHYFLTCHKYIELNPVRAGMVANPETYHWTSYHANALGVRSKLRTPHLVYLGLGSTEAERLVAYRNLFEKGLSGRELRKIRHATNQCLVLGSDHFKTEIERQSGQSGRAGKPGPKTTRVD